MSNQKDRHHNGKHKWQKDKKYLQNITQKTKDWTSRAKLFVFSYLTACYNINAAIIVMLYMSGNVSYILVFIQCISQGQ